MISSTSIVAYLVLFSAVAAVFLLVALLLGRLLRAQRPSPEKLASYECGEPAVGSSFVQFDLRFYVVALVFIIFEVEVALFFPAATIFGKSTQLMQQQQRAHGGDAAVAAQLARELEMTAQPPVGQSGELAGDARDLALASMVDLGTFFAVILVGFAYVWRRGDLDWVRAIGGTARAASPGPQLKVVR